MDAKIYDGDDIALARGFASYEAFLKGFASAMKRISPFSKLKSWGGRICGGPALRASINGGRWTVQCFCRTRGYASPRFRYYFCPQCGNVSTQGEAVPVTFPADDERQEIEALLLARPVLLGMTDDPLVAMREALPVVGGLRRDWDPDAGDTLQSLREQNEAAGL